ncbi:MAG: glycosyltransferase [Trueperaceae bacterium]
MLFPSPSETFISARLRTLTDLGASVRVHGLRTPHPSARALVEQRRLADIPTRHNSVGRTLRGALHALRKPHLLGTVLLHAVLPSWRKPPQLVRALLYTPRAFDILADLERDPPDVVHLAWGHYPSIVGMLVQHALADVVTSISLIAYDLAMEFAGTVTASRCADLVRTQARVNVPHIARFTGVAQDRIAIVYDGVDVRTIEDVAGGIERVPGRILTAGRLIAEKGMEDALRAFARVAKEVDHATFRVLGDGPLRPTLERLAASLDVADRVTFLGHVPHERVVQEMAAAESFLFLSRSERLPNVVKEAMACGSVCITTRTEGIEELVEDGVTGFLVNHDAVEDAARIAIAVANGRLDTDAVRAAARTHVERSFDHYDNVERLFGMWLTCVRDRRKAVAGGRLATAPSACSERTGSPAAGP